MFCFSVLSREKNSKQKYKRLSDNMGCRCLSQRKGETNTRLINMFCNIWIRLEITEYAHVTLKGIESKLSIRTTTCVFLIQR